MKHLELFSGTHSFGKVSSKMGFEVYSLDRDLGAECPLKSGYKSKNHFKEDIMTWNYKQFPKGYFDIITASPVCLWWSNLRNTWIGRKMKSHGNTIITREIIQEDIELYGIPMIDKVFEIIDYFKPQHYIIENPATGKMRFYINDLIPFYDVDYCKYSDFGYKKTTRFWTNIEGFKPKICKNDCENMITIKTQPGDKHIGNKKLIKGKTRRLHLSQIGEKSKKESIQKAIKENEYKLHKVCMGSWGKKGTEQTGIGCGDNRLERYRIPEKLIKELFNKII